MSAFKKYALDYMRELSGSSFFSFSGFMFSIGTAREILFCFLKVKISSTKVIPLRPGHTERVCVRGVATRLVCAGKFLCCGYTRCVFHPVLWNSKNAAAPRRARCGPAFNIIQWKHVPEATP